MGWQAINTPGGGVIVWAANERPRRWEGAAILEALRKGTRPGPDTPPDPLHLTREQEAPITARGYRLEQQTYVPWIGVAVGYGSIQRWLNPQEILDDLFPQCVNDITAMRARFAALGWTLTADGRDLSVRGQHGGYRAVAEWDMLEQVLTEIQAGTLKDTRQKPQPKQTCQGPCGQQFPRDELFYYGQGASMCRACIDAANAIIAAKREHLRRTITPLVQPWLDQIPERLLPLLTLGIVPASRRLCYETYHPATTRIQILQQKARADLLAALMDLIEDLAWKHRDTPFALLSGADLEQGVEQSEQDAPPDPAVTPHEQFARIHATITGADLDSATAERSLAALQQLFTADIDDELRRDIDSTFQTLQQWLDRETATAPPAM